MQKFAAIREKIESRGWEVVETRNISYLWVDEIWKARSKWSPVNLQIYLSLEVDPHNGSTEFDKVRWLYVSATPPLDWARDSGDLDPNKTPEIFFSPTPIGRGQEKQFRQFLDALDGWRVAAARIA